jgi:hypothetical protein
MKAPPDWAALRKARAAKIAKRARRKASKAARAIATSQPRLIAPADQFGDISGSGIDVTDWRARDDAWAKMDRR